MMTVFNCDRVPGGVVRVQQTWACNSHWRWVAVLLSLRASTKRAWYLNREVHVYEIKGVHRVWVCAKVSIVREIC